MVIGISRKEQKWKDIPPRNAFDLATGVLFERYVRRL
jgi:hypothetical protein